MYQCHYVYVYIYIYICILSSFYLQNLKHSKRWESRGWRMFQHDIFRCLRCLERRQGLLKPHASQMPWTCRTDIMNQDSQVKRPSDVTKTARGEPASPEGGLLLREGTMIIFEQCWEMFAQLTGATASFADGRTWGQSIYSPFIHSFLASCCFFFTLTVRALLLCFEPFLDGGLHHGAARSLQFSSFWIAEKVCPCGGSGLDGAEAHPLWMKPFKTPKMFNAVTGLGAAHKTDMFCTASCRLSQEVLSKNYPLNSFLKKLQ